MFVISKTPLTYPLQPIRSFGYLVYKLSYKCETQEVYRLPEKIQRNLYGFFENMTYQLYVMQLARIKR